MSISEAIRKQIEASGETRYQISQGSGVSQGVLSRFVSGETTLSLDNAEKLAKYFGLELVRKARGGERRGKPNKR